MDDPLDEFKLPPELYKYLSKQGHQKFVDRVFDIDQRFLEREPKLEAGYQYGHHLWELFDEAAGDLQHHPRFLEFVEGNGERQGLITEAIAVIRKELRWYPHNFDHDLRPYYLKAPIAKWRRIAIAAKESALAKPRAVEPAPVDRTAVYQTAKARLRDQWAERK